MGDKMILLVEPNYNNKYPPMGLMKLASYHKLNGDNVIFVKGVDEPQLNYSRIYITTLFTFDYKITLETIKYYASKYRCEVYVGGIMASLLNQRLVDDLVDFNNINVIVGQLTDSEMLNYEDSVNVDLLPLDYSILSHTLYSYKENSGYMGYTTRGCVNKCKFCAVPILENRFMISNNLTAQINKIIENSGEMRDLLLLDNNILGLDIDDLKVIVNEIKVLGFGKGSKFKSDYKIDKLYNDIKNLLPYIGVLDQTISAKVSEYTNEIQKFVIKKQTPKDMVIKNIYLSYIDRINTKMYNNDFSFLLHANFDLYYKILKPYYSKRNGSLRKVDFNQGLDARLLTEEKMKILSEINIDPFRLALDNVETIPQYVDAVKLASKYGVKNFSNYLLYNYTDKPEDLYIRLKINKDLANELNINIYSFPMKYAPITDVDRKYIGKNWNKLTLSNFRRILKPTMGIVGKGDSYFRKAFGNSFEEFYQIIHMPGDYVTYRTDNYYNIEKWKGKFNDLNNSQIVKLINDVVENGKMSNYDIEKIF